MPANDKQSSTGVRFLGVGLELAGAVAGFTLIGYWIDRHYGSYPWGVVICVALGLIGGMYNLIRESLAASRESGSEIQKTNGDRER